MDDETDDMTVAQRAAEIIRADDRRHDRSRDLSPSTSSVDKTQYVDIDMTPADQRKMNDAPFHRETAERLIRNGIAISGIQMQQYSDYDFRVWFNEISVSGGTVTFSYEE